MHILLVNILSFLGLAGCTLSVHIYTKKKSKKKLICPMRADCDTVIHSDYSKLFGVPVEILGMLYYLFVGCAYSIVSIAGLWSPLVATIFCGVSVTAVFFSLYLICLQIFVIKHWCSWCMSSALISFLILIASYLHLVFLL